VPVLSTDDSCISFSRAKAKISSILIGLLVTGSNIMWVSCNPYSIIVGLPHTWISQTSWEYVFAIVLAFLAAKFIFISGVICSTVMVLIIITIDKYYSRTIFLPLISYLHHISSFSIGITSIMVF